ncbi:hypothetical protein C362_05411 [Cryptococcus neoformans Bt1]|nr:hypothetical protein C362_05411 [Cryptococcus neoformans var. grubii Bt1]
MSLFFANSDTPQPDPISGAAYLSKLHKFLKSNAARLAPSAPRNTSRNLTPSIWQQGYTVLTLGLDPNSATIRNTKGPISLGFGMPSTKRTPPPKPLLLRLPPDRLLYLLLRWQALPQSLPHVGRTDTPIEEGVVIAARGMEGESRGKEGDVRSVRSWVGSIRSVSGTLVGGGQNGGWWGSKQTVNEDELLLSLYSMFTLIPALLIHPPNISEPPIAELIEAGGYTQLGGIDVRVPLDVLRNLQILELEHYDPRALLIPPNPGMRSLTVRDVSDGDDWIYELLTIPSNNSTEPRPRFPNLHHLSLLSASLLTFPTLPLESLTHLDLSYNLLDAIPSTLTSLTSLKSLNLSHNLITSLRNAPTSIGQISSINLSHNRIDCIVGLDRVMGLSRVDLRSNAIYDVGEIGRLALLSEIHEIWCASNPFDTPTAYPSEPAESWRVELGRTFREEGKDIILDGVAWTWSEERKIEAGLISRGIGANGRGGRGHERGWTQPHHGTQTHEDVSPERPTMAHRRSATHTHTTARSSSPTLPPSQSSSPRTRSPHVLPSPSFPHGPSQLRETSSISHPASGKSGKGRKKGKRRVINLEGDRNEDDSGAENVRERERSLGDVLEKGLGDDKVNNREEFQGSNGAAHENGREQSSAPASATEVKVVKKKKNKKRSKEPLAAGA